MGSRPRQGLAPSDCFLDIACGSPRGGVHFINYLDPGNYLGIEKQRRLVELGIEKELGRAAFLKQKPEFIISGDFEFHRFSKIPSYSIAQSLLTHLVPSGIHTCLRNLRAFVKDGHVAFATFFEGILHATARSPILTFASITPWRKWTPSAGAWAGSRLTSVIGTIPGTR